MPDLVDAIAVLLAPFVGSFLGLVAVRLPAGEPIVWGRSRCRACGAVLPVVTLVPILSWLALRGRCASCGERIGAVYPAVELASVGVALWALAMPSGWLLWATVALGWTLLLLASVDLRAGLLPDALTLPLIPAGLLVIYFAAPARLADHAIGAAAGFAVFATIGWIYLRLRGRHGLGLGDAKLLAAAGAWTGWQGLPGVVLWASAAALLYALIRAVRAGRLDPARPIPFGPALALGLWLVWLYGPPGLLRPITLAW